MCADGHHKSADVNRVLLPTHLTPKTYRITLEPDLIQFTFTGEEQVDFELNEPTDCITLNAKELVVHEASVQTEKNGLIMASDISYDTDNEYVIFKFDQMIDQSGVLNVKFTGVLNDKMAGFYRAKYEKDGEERHLSVTQFEATDCRRCIPSWDEPAIKSVFEVTLIVPKDRVALSNMNVVDERDHSEKLDKKVVKFAPTPVMSTYLLAFVVGEFEYIEQVASNGVNIRVYTQVGKTEQGKFGLDVAVKVLPWLEEYFDQKYPLPKCDLIAIPNFSAGAMENWGLITYRETALLVDPKNSSAHTRQWVALVVSHELSHQWFGNLSTMYWWTDLWLNEGFATYVEYLCVDKLFPEWNIFEQFVHDDFGRAQKLDGLESSHPVEVDVRVAAEVDEVFDAISYSKGCAIIRMLVNYLGLDTFNQGVKNYLEKFKYRNATTSDLWDALSEASGKPVAKVMTSWTRQTGYPLVTIVPGNDKKTFTVTQRRYLDKGIKEDDESLWHIPFGYTTSKNPDEPVFQLLSDRTNTLTIDTDDYEWIKFNSDQTGFFRVRYPSEFYKEQLVPAIKSKQLSAIDRLGIQEDAVSLARSGLLPSSVALGILSAYSDEDNYTVWTSLVDNLAQFYNIIKHEPCAVQFKSYAIGLLRKQCDRLGWEPKPNESHLDTMLRALVISNMVKYGDSTILEQSKQKYSLLTSHSDAVIPDLRSTVMSAVVATGGEKEFEQIIEAYKKNTLQEEQIRCLKALGASKDVKLIRRALDFGLSEFVRSQDTFYIVYGVADNPVATELLWNWFTENIETLKERYDGGGFLYGRFIKSATEGFTTKELLDKVKIFFSDAKNKTPGSIRSIEQAIEGVELNQAWSERSKQDIAYFFTQ